LHAALEGTSVAVGVGSMAGDREMAGCLDPAWDWEGDQARVHYLHPQQQTMDARMQARVSGRMVDGDRDEHGDDAPGRRGAMVVGGVEARRRRRDRRKLHCRRGVCAKRK
jgi:hypothetical protein